ncbi:MAG: TonB-dependent receptor [Acidobacteriia bacterium]|nr:TonB-dependent receptor [Terriglobia bacterium]
MSRSSLAVHVALLIVSIVALTALGQAQYRASIQGVVTDPTGAVIPGATITLKDKETNRTLTATSDDSGVYNITALPPSTYELTAEKTGFKKKTIQNFTVLSEQANALNIQLDLGASSETVNVSADQIPAIDTETAQISGTVDSKHIQALPSFGRDVFQLAQLAPGVFGDGSRNAGGDTNGLQGNQGPGGSGGGTGVFATENRPQVSANGGRTEANNVTLDGIGITSVSWGGAAIVTPNEDSVKEVKVVSNSYDAESGRFSGAQIQVISQNGTNDYHGSFFFKRDTPGLNAFQHWHGPAHQPQTPTRNNFRYNDWGGSIGGPILKNKLFAFFSYERIANTGISNAQGWYETPSLLASAPAGSIAAQYAAYPGEAVHFTTQVDQTCASVSLVEGVNCHMVAGQGLDLGRPLDTSLFPLGTMDPSFSGNLHPGLGGDGTGSSANLDGVADIVNVLASGPNNQTNQQFNGRLDFNATSRDLVAFSIYRVPVSSLSYNGYRAANLFHHDATNEAETALWDHTFSPSLINELRVNAAGWRWNELKGNPQIPLGLPQTGAIGDPNNGNLIGTACPGCNGLGGPAGSIFDQWTYNLKDVATKVYHSHTIKFGGEVTKLRFVQDAPWSARPNFFFNSYWDFLNDAPYKESGTFNPTNGSPTDVRKDSRSTIYGFFVQDDWKVRSNLTVNLGLRWEYFGPISFLHNQLSTLVLGPGANALTGMSMHLGGNLYQADKGNFGPQLGFAWSPTKYNSKLVLRGGFGISYNGEQEAITLNGWPNVPFTDGNATLFTCPPAEGGGCGPSQVVYAIPSDPHQFLPYPANPNTILTFGPNNLPVPGSGITFSNVGVTGFPTRFSTPYTYHYSMQGQYDIGGNWIASIGYQGGMSRHFTQQYNANLLYGALGYTLNPVVQAVDFYNQNSNAVSNALLTQLKHTFSHSFDLDAQYRLSRSYDNQSGPYSISNYIWSSRANWGPSDFDVSHAFKLWGIYSPTIFHGENGWLEKVAGGWSISGILNMHSGFPWSPVSYLTCNIVYANGACYQGGNQVLPAQYLGGAGSDHSNSKFLSSGGNFPNGGPSYFTTAIVTECTLPFPQTCPNQLPTAPGIARNSQRGPRYFDIDATISKSFGLPKIPVLGENAKFEFRANIFNLTNKLNLNPSNMVTNINDPLFGEVTGALGGRTIELQARFSF